ncbi:uncharacterized protein LOC135366019 isoform X2 [Ornithodoros turicata]|uniref:uncharacterized protein LOC135366019 isoform X2 n=1 Tax=Ornithodoros turicata TaxID=34597 RepID=UPI00313885E6
MACITIPVALLSVISSSLSLTTSEISNVRGDAPIAATIKRTTGGTYGTTNCRNDKILDVAPFQVLRPVESVTHCLVACLMRGPQCKAFNYGNRTCSLLDTVLCHIRGPQGFLHLKDMPGFSYYDLFDRGGIQASRAKLPGCISGEDISESCISDSPPHSSTIGDADMNTTSPTLTDASGGTSTPSVGLETVTGRLPQETTDIDIPATSATASSLFYIKITPETFENARNICLTEGAFLARPKTADDHKALVLLMKTHRAQRLWIGVQRPEDEPRYLNGDPVPPTSQRWGPGQPNNSGGTQICVEMRQSLSFLWNDFDCENPAPFACQRSSAAPLTSTTVPIGE